MQFLKMSAAAAGLLGVSVIALSMGGAPQAAAAPLNLLQAPSFAVDSPIIQARYRARKRSARRVRSARRSRRAVRSRYIRRGRRGNGAAAAAMIGAFGTIVAAAIAADSRRERYVPYHRPYYQPYQPHYSNYGYAPAPVYYRRRAPVYYHQPAPVYGGYYVKKKRRGLGRIFGKRKRVFVPYAAPAPRYRPQRAFRPRVVRNPQFRAARSFRPARARPRGRGGPLRRAFRRWR